LAQLLGRGRGVKPGETSSIQMQTTINPLCRVMTYDYIGGKVNSDREKYRDMVLDAAETILSTFGFT
jgi:hypothetical protein